MFTVMDLKLTSNVMQEIEKYRKSNFDKDCPEFIVKVKTVERDNDRYWLTLIDGSDSEIWAMCSKLLTRRIPIQDLLVQPAIKICHYYLHRLKAAEFLENSTKQYIDVIGISNMDILSDRKVSKMITIELEKKKCKRKTEFRLAASPSKKISIVSRGVQTDEKNTNYKVNQSEEPEIIVITGTTTALSSTAMRTEITTPATSSIVRTTTAITAPRIATSATPMTSMARSPTTKPKIATVVIPTSSIIRPTTTITPGLSATPSTSAISADKKPEASSSTHIPIIPSPAAERRCPISSLYECTESPLIRVTLFKQCRELNIDADTGIYLSCGFNDFSGSIMSFIFPPICEEIIKFLKPVVVLEIKNAAVFKASPRAKKHCASDFELRITKSSQLKIIYGTSIMYQFPPGLQTCVPDSKHLSTTEKNVPIALLAECASSPLIRGKVLKRGPSPKNRNGYIYISGCISDYSGEIEFAIQEPISVFIDPFFRMGVAVAIKNAKIEANDSTVFEKVSNNKLLLLINSKSAINIYYKNKCLYKYPTNGGIPMDMGISANNVGSSVKPSVCNINTKQPKIVYTAIQDVKRTPLGTVSNIIGIVTCVEDLLPNASGKPESQRRYVGLVDETGSLSVLLWGHYTAFKFPLGAIIKLFNFRLHSYSGFLELTSTSKSSITMADECEEKSRLEKWYQFILHKFPW